MGVARRSGAKEARRHVRHRRRHQSRLRLSSGVPCPTEECAQPPTFASPESPARSLIPVAELRETVDRGFVITPRPMAARDQAPLSCSGGGSRFDAPLGTPPSGPSIFENLQAK
jgi:hypothetical protein